MSTSPTAVETVVPVDDESPRSPHKSKKRARRRTAKALAYVSLAVTAVLVLSEPWLLLPLVTLMVALSLWD